jgi:3-mercaptopyruvate sulfurtransferase SseA
MRLLISITAVTLLALILLAACNSNEQKANVPCVPSSPDGEPRRITPAELKDAVAKNSAVIIDVRGEPAYKEGHIKGARLIPFGDILKHVDELPRDKMIATYCS